MHQYVQRKSTAAANSRDRRERARELRMPLPQIEPKVASIRPQIKQNEYPHASSHQQSAFSASSYSESSVGDGEVQSGRPATSWIADPSQKSPGSNIKPSDELERELNGEEGDELDDRLRYDPWPSQDDPFVADGDSYPATTSGGEPENQDSNGRNSNPFQTHLKNLNSPLPSRSGINALSASRALPSILNGDGIRSRLNAESLVYNRVLNGSSPRLPTNDLQHFSQPFQPLQAHQMHELFGRPIVVNDGNLPLVTSEAGQFQGTASNDSPTPPTQRKPQSPYFSQNDSTPWRTGVVDGMRLAENQRGRELDLDTAGAHHLHDDDVELQDHADTDENVPEQLDYSADELETMDVSILRNEPFDAVNAQKERLSPNHDPSLSLDKQLAHFLEVGDPERQQAFLASLPMSEWEQAGEWFTERFADLNRKLRKCRQERRKVAKSFEDQLWTKYDSIMEDEESMDNTLSEMKKSGNAMLAQASAKRKQVPP